MLEENARINERDLQESFSQRNVRSELSPWREIWGVLVLIFQAKYVKGDYHQGTVKRRKQALCERFVSIYISHIQLAKDVLSQATPLGVRGRGSHS